MVNGLKFYQPIQACPKVFETDLISGSTYYTVFHSYTKIPMVKAETNILYGIEIVRDYFYMGKLKVFNNLDFLKDESVKYVYKTNKDDTNTNDKPKDAHNHLMDCLRYIIARLPRKPEELKSIVTSRTKQIYAVFGENNNSPQNRDSKGVIRGGWKM